MPPPAARVALVRASTNSLELCWVPSPTAQCYLLEIQKIEQTPPYNPPGSIITGFVANAKSTTPQKFPIGTNSPYHPTPILTPIEPRPKPIAIPAQIVGKFR